MSLLPIKLFGWRAPIWQGDPTVVDRWRWLRRHLRPGPLRTLDAGCGAGAFTLFAARLGNSALGVSFDAAQVAKAEARARIVQSHGIAFRVGDLRALDQFAADLGRFDQVIVCETIEHIHNDAKLVADLAALLEPGGTILLTAPYAQHRPLWGEKLSKGEDGGHVRWGYTHNDIRHMFDICGLEVLVEEYVSGLVSQKLTSLQFGLRRLSDLLAWALTFPLRVLQPLDGPLTRLTRYPPLSVAVVGRKPA